MTRFIVLLTTLVIMANAQDASYQQGLSIHNQQIQEHLRKEAEQQRGVNQFGASSFPQQQHYQQQPQNNYQQNNYEDDGQYRPELYSNSVSNNNYNNNYRPNPEAEYQAGLKAHADAIQVHLRKEAAFQPQTPHGGDPAYQQGLQIHQRQLQDHLAKEQQHGGPAYSHPQPQPQQYSQPAHHAPTGANSAYEYGIQLHNQQIQQHLRAEQQQQSQVGHATQYHSSQQRDNYQQQSNSYPVNRPTSGKVSLANLGF